MGTRDMSQPSTTLRAADCAYDEGRVFAHNLNEAAEGFFKLMLGRRFEAIIARAFVQPDHDLSYQNVTFAELNDRIVGMVSGYTAEQHRRSSLDPLRRAAGRWHLRMRTVSTLLAPMMRIIDTVADGDFYLQAIAVDKELRGKGVGKVLMNFFEESARAAGSHRLALDVSARNESACKFYSRCGMTIESQWPRRIAIPGLKFFRMTKPL